MFAVVILSNLEDLVSDKQMNHHRDVGNERIDSELLWEEEGSLRIRQKGLA